MCARAVVSETPLSHPLLLWRDRPSVIPVLSYSLKTIGNQTFSWKGHRTTEAEKGQSKNILQILKRREQESVFSSTEGKRLAIEHYFERGFCYETIVHFPWDFNEREDFEEKATSLWVTKKKPPSFRTHCSGNN